MIELLGYASVKAKAETVNDLREFVGWLDKFKIDGDLEMDSYSGHLFVTIADSVDGNEISMIECADHGADESTWDVLIETHKHKKEPEVKPGWDWVRSIVLPDSARYADPTRPE